MVPRRLCTGPALISLRLSACRGRSSASTACGRARPRPPSRSDSALTTETADAVQAAGGRRRPCRRICRRNAASSGSPPAPTRFLNLGCGSTGMPRPLSRTVRTVAVLAARTSMQLAWPATASSMALSRISAARWCSAALVGAADIHAGAAADGLQPLQHLDVLGGVVRPHRGRPSSGGAEQIVHAVFPCRGRTLPSAAESVQAWAAPNRRRSGGVRGNAGWRQAVGRHGDEA